MRDDVRHEFADTELGLVDDLSEPPESQVKTQQAPQGGDLLGVGCEGQVPRLPSHTRFLDHSNLFRRMPTPPRPRPLDGVSRPLTLSSVRSKNAADSSLHAMCTTGFPLPSDWQAHLLARD